MLVKVLYLNNILGEERVIVSPIAGTTRDAVDTYVEKNGQQVPSYRYSRS